MYKQTKTRQTDAAYTAIPTFPSVNVDNNMAYMGVTGNKNAQHCQPCVQLRYI